MPHSAKTYDRTQIATDGEAITTRFQRTPVHKLPERVKQDTNPKKREPPQQCPVHMSVCRNTRRKKQYQSDCRIGGERKPVCLICTHVSKTCFEGVPYKFAGYNLQVA